MKKRAEVGAPLLISIGICGLHAIHGSFKIVHIPIRSLNTKVLKWMHALLADTPTRAIYEEVTGCADYPKRFCNICCC